MRSMNLPSALGRKDEEAWDRGLLSPAANLLSGVAVWDINVHL